MSLGQFLQHVGTELMSTGTVQIWPGMPVQEALIEGERVAGIRLTDQGVDKDGNPEATFLPGMDVRAALTVVGDGPVGVVGRQLDTEFGLPEGHHQREWAVGMKMVVDLPEGTSARTGHGVSHLRLSGTGDLRLPVRASGPCRDGGHLRPFVVRQSGAHLVSLPAALHAASVSVAVSEGGQTAQLGRQIAAGIRPSRRTVSGGRWLRANRRMLRQHQRADRQRRGRSLDHRRPTRRSGAGTAEGGQAAIQGKSRSYLRGAAARQLGGGGGPSRREGARWLPPGHDPRTVGDGDRGLHRRQALGERRAETDAQPRGVLPREDSRRASWPRSWTTAARAA